MLVSLHDFSYQQHTAGPNNSYSDKHSQNKASQLTFSHTGLKSGINYFKQISKKGQH